MSSQETEIEEKVCEDRISELPEDLLVQILSLVPTKEAVTTMLLSKRWNLVWTMVPKLDYMVTCKDKKNVLDFLDKSMQFHRAPVLESLRIQFADVFVFHVDVYIGKWVSNAVYRSVRELTLEIYLRCEPQNLPSCFYTSKTLVKLILWYNILIDVPPQACLPSLQSLMLHCVVYKDIDSHVKLLSSCPVLKDLYVSRDRKSKETIFSVKVPSLKRLKYIGDDVKFSRSSLVIDSPGLHYLRILGSSVDDCSVQNMPHLDEAYLPICFSSHPNEKLLRSISSVKSLELVLNEVTFCSAINFSRLIEFKMIFPFGSSDSNWFEPLKILLNNAPKLKVLMINNHYYNTTQLSWNQPSSVPLCLLSHLEIFEWKGFGGLREEKEFVAYIFSNANCLKTAGISSESLYNHVMEKKIKEELESMYRVSASSKLLFSANLKWRYRKRDYCLL